MGVVSNWLRKKKKKSRYTVRLQVTSGRLTSLFVPSAFLSPPVKHLLLCHLLRIGLFLSFPFLSSPLDLCPFLLSPLISTGFLFHLFLLASFPFFYLFLSFPFHWLPFLCFPFHWLSILSFGLFLPLASVSLHWLPFLFL